MTLNNRQIHLTCAFLLLLFCGSSVALAPQQGARDSAFDMSDGYRDRLAILNEINCEPGVTFDAKGTPIYTREQPKEGEACQAIRIQRVSIEDDKIKISAQRIHLVYDCGRSEYRELPLGPTPNKRDSSILGEQVTFKLDLPRQADAAKAAELMDQTFTFSAKDSPEVIRAPKGGIISPKAIYNPQPGFSDEARKAKYQGAVQLRVVIGEDGRVRSASVTRPLGKGLDEKALEAVKSWKFRPALKCGVPIEFPVVIEVDFHLS